MTKFGNISTMTLGLRFAIDNVDGKKVDVDGQQYKHGNGALSKQP